MRSFILLKSSSRLKSGVMLRSTSLADLVGSWEGIGSFDSSSFRVKFGF